MYVCAFLHVSVGPGGGQEKLDPPGIVVSGSCEPYDLGSVNQTSALCMRSLHSAISLDPECIDTS